ncbi:MAG: 3-keto-5-aminohexanoate cleavage protein [Silicimonas sp.]|nr:3-keto-5-aminohexanoate cleavage protein [Silicimonas sp.]
MQNGRKIMVSPTGARRSKADHPHLPINIEEIAAEARACQEAGAAALHLHVRDAAGRHSIDPGLYREAIAAVRAAAPGMDIQVTTEAANVFFVQDQYDTLFDLAPAWASLAVREAARDVELAARLYSMAEAQGIVLQHILYDRSDLDILRRFRSDGTIRETNPDVFLAFGAYAPPRNADPAAVGDAVQALNGDFQTWGACAFGPTEQATLIEVVRRGGQPRIGFENNIHLPDGTVATSTADNVARFVTALYQEGLL